MENAWENQKRALATQIKVVSIAANWGWETLQGDFNETPTTGQIITNAIVTMIPVVDQIADVRDLVANIKLLVWDKRYHEFLVWLALFFTLIGLIPTIGSALKGVLKILWKGAKLDEVLSVFNWFMKGNGVKWLKELQGGKLKQYADEAADIGHQVFDAIIGKLKDLKPYIPNAMTDAHKELNGILATLNTVKGKINGMFEQVAKEMSEKLSKLLDEAKPKVESSSTRGSYSKQQAKEKPPEDVIIDTSSRRSTIGGREVVPNKNISHVYQPGLDRIPLPRTEGLGARATTQELLDTGAIPGTQGVILNQRTVVFDDIWKISENAGVEFILTKESGNFVLRSGSMTTAPVKLGQRPILHTYPTDEFGINSLLPSTADINVLNAAWARNPNGPRPVSQILTGQDTPTVFRATGLDPLPKKNTNKR
ncbi:MAG: hypothetical protein AAFZ92_05160 [Pseudomonadota bacterium]